MAKPKKIWLTICDCPKELQQDMWYLKRKDALHDTWRHLTRDTGGRCPHCMTKPRPVAYVPEVK